MPHYAVVTTDGESHSASMLSGEDWRPGDVIPRGSALPSLRAVDVLESEHPDRFAVLLVEEVARLLPASAGGSGRRNRAAQRMQRPGL